jgi:hypothetical protein
MNYEVYGRIVVNPENKTRKHISQAGWKRVIYIELEEDLSALYRWFIFKRYNLRLTKPLRNTHMTLVNDKVDDRTLFDKVSQDLSGSIVKVSVYLDIETDGIRWWLKSESEEAEKIRVFLGLDPAPYFPYHITIGNVFNKDLEHAEYIRNIISKFGKEYN